MRKILVPIISIVFVVVAVTCFFQILGRRGLVNSNVSAAEVGVPSYLIGSKYSIGYKNLLIEPPYVWYWGWDHANCNPETSVGRDGKVCGTPGTEPYSYGPYGSLNYNFGYVSGEGLLSYLDAAKAMKISPDQVGKPVWFSGPILATSDGASMVSPTVDVVCRDGDTKKIPIWSEQTNTYLNWIRNVVPLIKNNSSLKFFTITHGIDGEGYFVRPECERELKAMRQADPSIPDPLANVNNYVNSVTDEYYKQFCNGTYNAFLQTCFGTMKPLFVNKSTWGDSFGWGGRYTPPIGIKFNGYTADTGQGVIYQKYRGYGTLEAMKRYSQIVPSSVEPKHGNFFLGQEMGTYWFGLAMLWLRPSNIDINPSYGLWGTYKDDPDYFDLLNNHLNVTAFTTPDTWIAFRDTNDLCNATTQDQYDNNICVTTDNGSYGSGLRGDYDFFLKRPDNLMNNKTVLLRKGGFNNAQYEAEIPVSARDHKFAKYVRRTDKAAGNFYMSFDVDNDYPWSGKSGQSFEIAVSFLDVGSGDYFIEYKNSSGSLVRKSISRGNSGVWKTEKVVLDDAFFNDQMGADPDGGGASTYTDFRIYNGGASSPNVYLHMVKAKGMGAKPSGVKERSEIICNTNGSTNIKGEALSLAVTLKDKTGSPLSGKTVKYAVDPYWYTNRIGFGQTNSSGVSNLAIETSSIPGASWVHEVEVSFPGDSEYFGTSAFCYFQLDYPGAIKRTISATTNLQSVKVGDVVTVNVSIDGNSSGGQFIAEGEGFGMPACYGSFDTNGKGSCQFKIGGMAIAGNRVLGVYTAPLNGQGGASAHLTLNVIDTSDIWPTPQPVTPTITRVPTITRQPTVSPTTINPTATSRPTATSIPVVTLNLKAGWNNLNWDQNYPIGKKFSDIPNSCLLVETNQGNFWRIYVKNYGGENLSFERGRQYQINCTSDTSWQI